MLLPIRVTTIAVVVASTSGCQTGQCQAAAGPSVGPGKTLEARCRQQASRASSQAGTGNVVKTVAASTIGGIVGNAVGEGCAAIIRHVGTVDIMDMLLSGRIEALEPLSGLELAQR